jgi:hypothetical protein
VRWTACWTKAAVFAAPQGLFNHARKLGPKLLLQSAQSHHATAL